ncbi:MAG: TerC family protein [Gammaproteobacteria bacterium]|nr:TerC family protein [Gammaproteobacteria bacterium]
MDWASPEFWVSVGQIIMIDILLGGDNAIVIALASRRLPEAQRKQAIFWGVLGAIALRVILIFFALQLLKIPFLKIVGGLLLLWIGIKLLLPQHEGDREIDASDHLLGAIKTIVIADAVMSLDNVIGIAGAAKGSLGLVVFGLIFSIPIIIWGSRFVLTLMDRFSVIVLFGAGLLGWIGGGMIADDVVLAPHVNDFSIDAHYLSAVVGALVVAVLGRWLASRTPKPTEGA